MMDNFDNVDQMLQQLYENAVSKKSELESELRKLDATIEKLGVLYGAKTYTSDMLKSAEPVRRGRKPELNKAPRVVKEKKVKEERLEDILWACREHLHGKAENVTRLEAAFRTLGVKL